MAIADQKLRVIGEVFSSPYIFVKLWIVGIIELLFVGGPTAIPRLVISGRVDAINRVLRGRFPPHIREEILKTRAPALADANSLRPIISVADIGRSRATLFHGAPSTIFGSLFHAVRLQCRSGCFFLKTTAALRLIRPCKTSLPNNRDVPTITRTTISALSPRLAPMRDHLRIYLDVYKKPAEPLTS